jgi:hypothetical protein
MISTLIALPYEIARGPLAFVDARLSNRLADDSARRLVLDRTLGSADKVAGTILGNHAIAARGADRLERSDKLRTAARREHEAGATRQQARDEAAAGRREAARKRKDAEKRVESGLQEAQATEARGKQEARANAKKTASAKKAAADRRAAARTATVEQRKQRVESGAEAKKKAAQRKTKSELDEAREAKQAAAKARADAERLGDLTEAKQEQRKQS